MSTSLPVSSALEGQMWHNKHQCRQCRSSLIKSMLWSFLLLFVVSHSWYHCWVADAQRSPEYQPMPPHVLLVITILLVKKHCPKPFRTSNIISPHLKSHLLTKFQTMELKQWRPGVIVVIHSPFATAEVDLNHFIGGNYLNILTRFIPAGIEVPRKQTEARSKQHKVNRNL